MVAELIFGKGVLALSVLAGDDFHVVATRHGGRFASRPVVVRNLRQAGHLGDLLRDVRVELEVKAFGVSALCGIWANSKSFLAPASRADRVGQQATQRTVSTGMSGRIPISSDSCYNPALN
jgi:hypothetical protein